MRTPLLLLGLALCLAPVAAAQQPAGPAPLSLDELKRLARSDSNDATVHYRLGMAYWDKRKWDDAEAALERAVTVAPGYADALLALAALPERRGRLYWQLRAERQGRDTVEALFKLSSARYRRAFLMDPLVDLRPLGKFEGEDEGYIVSRGRIFYFSLWWANDLEKAVNEFRSGRYDRAYERTTRLIADPRSGASDMQAPSPVLWYHGLAAAHLKDFEPAIRDFAILTGRAYALEQDSTNGNAWVPLLTNDYRYVLATMLYLGGHAGQAVPTFRRVLEVDLAVYSAHVQLARIFEQSGMLDSALVERQLALAVNPEDPDVNVEYAVTLLRAGRLADAAEPLADAARLNPHDARVPYLQGLVADQQGHSEEARAAWRRFLAIAPSRFAAQRDEIATKLAQTGP